MLFKNYNYFLIIIVMLTINHSSFAMNSDGELYRVDKNNTIIAKYTDNIKVKNCNHSLNFLIDKQLSRKAYRYRTWDKENSQYEKSHLLVNGFHIYERDSEFFCEYDSFTTKTFHKIGIGKKNTNIPIDWMSFESKLKSTDTIFHHKSQGVGNGHSEPQFIKDLEGLWKTEPNTLLKHFIPRANTLENSTMIMSGLDLYGAFDMCDSCLKELIEFRKRHQIGQESISYAIKDKLKNKCTDVKENCFVVIYHTLHPYASASYHTTYDDVDYPLYYGPVCKMVSKNNRVTYPSFPAFMPKYKNNILENPVLRNTTLFQATKVKVEKDIIYGQIHSLNGKIGDYKKPEMSDKFEFIFDNY